MPLKDVEARKQYDHDHYEREKQDPDKVEHWRAKAREYYWQHRKERLGAMQKYRQFNAEVIAQNRKTPRVRQYHARKAVEYYALNPHKFRERSCANYLKNKEKLAQLRYERKDHNKKQCIGFLGGKCQRCGYAEHDAPLQFHHRDPKLKKFEIVRKLSNGWSMERPELVEELDKCDLLCANCHAIVESGKQRQYDKVGLENPSKEETHA